MNLASLVGLLKKIQLLRNLCCIKGSLYIDDPDKKHNKKNQHREYVPPTMDESHP